MRPQAVVVVWQLLWWLAVAAAVAAAHELLSARWPAAIAFAAVFARFAAVPDKLEASAYVICGAVAGIGAALFSSGTGRAFADVALLRVGGPVAVAVLAAAYGVVVGTLAGLIAARVGRRTPDAETMALLDRSDGTLFGTTTSRRTHPALVAFAVIGMLALVLFIVWGTRRS